MRKIRLFIMSALVLATLGVSFTPLRASGGGWSDTSYYDDASFTNWVGERRIDGCNSQNNMNVGVTSDYMEISSDDCLGASYQCTACIYSYPGWNCVYVCSNYHG